MALTEVFITYLALAISTACTLVMHAHGLSYWRAIPAGTATMLVLQITLLLLLEWLMGDASRVPPKNPVAEDLRDRRPDRDE